MGNISIMASWNSPRVGPECVRDTAILVAKSLGMLTWRKRLMVAKCECEIFKNTYNDLPSQAAELY